MRPGSCISRCGHRMAPQVPLHIAPKPSRPPVAAQFEPAPPTAPPVATENHPEPVRVPVREKPSPMPPPVRHKQELVIAHNAPPPVEPQPEPAPAPAAPVAPITPAAPAAPSAPAQHESVPVQNVSLPPPTQSAGNIESRVPPSVILTAGTLLSVRIGETLSSARNQVGDTFLATLTQPLIVDGWVIAERGARVEGRVVDATPAGRVKGASHLGISIVRLATVRRPVRPCSHRAVRKGWCEFNGHRRG